MTVIKHRNKGFSLIELLIVVAVIAVIAAIALPSLLASKAAANEASAISSLRALHSAIRVYSKRFHSTPTFEDLARNEMIDEVLGSGTKSGYSFELKTEGSIKDAGIIASPTTWGSTGERRFKINWMGQITFTTNEADTDMIEAKPLGATSGN